MSEEPMVSAAAMNALVLGILLTVILYAAAGGIVDAGRWLWRFHLEGVERVRRYELRVAVDRHPAGAWR